MNLISAFENTLLILSKDIDKGALFLVLQYTYFFIIVLKFFSSWNKC